MQATKQKNPWAAAAVSVPRATGPVEQRPGEYTRTDKPLHTMHEGGDGAAGGSCGAVGLPVPRQTAAVGKRRHGARTQVWPEPRCCL